MAGIVDINGIEFSAYSDATASSTRDICFSLRTKDRSEIKKLLSNFNAEDSVTVKLYADLAKTDLVATSTGEITNLQVRLTDRSNKPTVTFEVLGNTTLSL